MKIFAEVRVGEERWFCRCDAEWIAIVERLKLTPCPHCKVVGMLIRHGCLRGSDESSPREFRIVCSS